jgi:hypothetical protein
MPLFQILSDESSYGGLADIPGLPQRLLARQLVALEGILTHTQTSLAEMEAASRAMEKLSRDARQQVRQAKGLTPGARRHRAGPVPSVDDCLDGLQEIRWVPVPLLLLCRKNVVVCNNSYRPHRFPLQPNVHG